MPFSPNILVRTQPYPIRKYNTISCVLKAHRTTVAGVLVGAGALVSYAVYQRYLFDNESEMRKKMARERMAKML